MFCDFDYKSIWAADFCGRAQYIRHRIGKSLFVSFISSVYAVIGI